MDIEEMVRQINNNSIKLDPWESDFISSINESIETNFALTLKQIKKIEKIYKKVFEQ